MTGSGPSIGRITVTTLSSTRGSVGKLSAGTQDRAIAAFEAAHKEIGEKLQQVGFMRLNNSLKKNRAGSRGDWRDGRGLRAALKDPEFRHAPAKGWAYGVVVGSQLVIDRHGAKDYWRTIESGGGPVGRWFPNYVLNMGGQPVSSPAALNAESRMTSPAQQRKMLSVSRSYHPRYTAQLRQAFATENARTASAFGRAQANWAGKGGAVFAEGVQGKNGRRGAGRGSVEGGHGKRGYFQVKNAIKAVGYMQAMDNALREWIEDGTILAIYQKHFDAKKVGISLSRHKVGSLRVRATHSPDVLPSRLFSAMTANSPL